MSTPSQNRKWILNFYVMAEVLSMGCNVMLSVLSRMGSEEQNNASNYTSTQYITATLIAVLFSAAYGRTCYKLQGEEILKEGNEAELDTLVRRNSEKNGVITKDHASEIAYLLIIVLALGFEVDAQIASLKPWVIGLKDHTRQNVIGHLSGWENAIPLAILLVDIPFEFTSSWYPSAVDFHKNKASRSFAKGIIKKTALFGKKVMPCCKAKPVIGFIKWGGVLSHTVDHMIDPLICIPASWIVKTYFDHLPVGTPIILATFLAGYSLIAATTFVETSMWDGKNCEKHIKQALDIKHDSTPKPLNRCSRGFLHFSVWVQIFVHALNTARPYMLLARHFMLGLSLRTQLLGTLLPAAAQAAAFIPGYWLSETKCCFDDIQSRQLRPTA